MGSNICISIERGLIRSLWIVIIVLSVGSSAAADPARSRILMDQQRTEYQIRKYCGPSRRRPSELGLPTKAWEAIRKNSFALTRVAACDGAHDALRTIRLLMENAASAAELFEFWFYDQDYSDLERELYQKHLLGPFLSTQNCLDSQKRFEEAGVGMTKCRPQSSLKF